MRNDRGQTDCISFCINSGSICANLISEINAKNRNLNFFLDFSLLTMSNEANNSHRTCWNTNKNGLWWIFEVPTAYQFLHVEPNTSVFSMAFLTQNKNRKVGSFFAKKKKWNFITLVFCLAFFNWHLTLLSAIAKLFLSHLASDDEINSVVKFRAMGQLKKRELNSFCYRKIRIWQS